MEKYKIHPKARIEFTGLEHAVGVDLFKKIEDFNLHVARIEDLIRQQKQRVKQLDGAASAASEYLRSKLQEIPDADDHRKIVVKGLEAILDTIDSQIEQHKKELSKLLNHNTNGMDTPAPTDTVQRQA